MEKEFCINDRFLIKPFVNSVVDLTTGKETRLEGRLMQLLCILCERAGGTVTRDELINIIWQDYGGGDEGLTQAVSMLRKVLLDNDKLLIQTVPKKGYVLNTGVNLNETQAPKDTNRSVFRFPLKWVAAISVAVVITIGVFFYFKPSSGKKEVSRMPTRVDFPTNMRDEDQLQENENNTIITQGNDSTTYKLVVIDDRPPKFYINNKLVLEDRWESHTYLINSLKYRLDQKKEGYTISCNHSRVY